MLRCDANPLGWGLRSPLRPLLRRFVKWIEDGISEDPFLNPELMKNNPWVEKGKCTIL
uniref:G protein gamma domain-containing protein n=1 Tax=Strix occidentalis caurina TaxID=311401 RepID=A0A8D0FK83_STROC